MGPGHLNETPSGSAVTKDAEPCRLRTNQRGFHRTLLPGCALIDKHKGIDVLIAVDAGKSNRQVIAIDWNGKQILGLSVPQDEPKLCAIMKVPAGISCRRHGWLPARFGAASHRGLAS